MRTIVLVAAIVALGAGSTACASKGYVRDRVGEVNEKVGTMSDSLEETQERTRQNAARIGEVDDKATSAGRTAEEARMVAGDAAARADALDQANRRLVYEVVLSEDKSRFQFGRATLAPEARAEIDRLVEQLTANPQHLFIEIEGHTDSVGSAAFNERLGMQRAEAVRRYLYEEHNIPLHKMNVISYGQTKPIAPNTTRDGRAQNRRVVVKVLT
jgi:peptidoglycan-associated lipoprotein